jgi:5-(carboxyamino)imidazole ribonucleotide synthase
VKRIGPPQRIGVLGSGQLGLMFAGAAARLGFQVHVFSPTHSSPAEQFAHSVTVAHYEDREAMVNFAKSVDVITYEFENIPAETLDLAADLVPTFPSRDLLYISQNRRREKESLSAAGFRVVPFAFAKDLAGVEQAAAALGFPVILKSASFGYDGKGQARVNTAEQLKTAYQALGHQEVVVEKKVQLTCELSVIVARSESKNLSTYGPIENLHVDGILDLSLCPARVSEDLRSQAIEVASAIADHFNLIGVLCVEFFVVDEDQLLVNELAPRPHNSGHLTIEAHTTSQFAQQARCVTGLEPGDATQLRPAAMANLLGDIWPADWAHMLNHAPDVALHLYGKDTPAKGRKMGHLTALAATAEDALAKVQRARTLLHQRLTTSVADD